MILLNHRGLWSKGLHDGFSVVFSVVKLLYELVFLPLHQWQS
jgi:hypothetical protein